MTTTHDAYRRVAALVEVSHRYASMIQGLITAIAESLPNVEGDARERLVSAFDDASAQITAIDDALSAALADLPEGSSG